MRLVQKKNCVAFKKIIKKKSMQPSISNKLGHKLFLIYVFQDKL